jgi:hypothetical protein
VIKESTQDWNTGCICIRWTGEQPSDAEFLEYARKYWQVEGQLIDITIPTRFRGSMCDSSAVIQPL